jgi:hypothetical protein
MVDHSASSQCLDSGTRGNDLTSLLTVVVSPTSSLKRSLLHVGLGLSDCDDVNSNAEYSFGRGERKTKGVGHRLAGNSAVVDIQTGT